MLSRRSALIGMSALLVSGSKASAQEYPARPVTLIVPWAAGGPTDVAMRAVADAASKHLGQPFIIDNKAGGAGTVGPATLAATAKPDGYTIAQIAVPVFRLPIMQKTSWTADDFTYIARLTGYVFGVHAGAATPFMKWQDVVDFAKQNPGKVTYGTSGTGGSLHLGMEQIAEKAGIKLTHVPFKGTSEVVAAVAGGHVMLGAGSIGAAQPLVEAGKARHLNVWTAARRKSFPDVPTLNELGYNLVIDSPWGVGGPKGMDPKVVAKIHDAFAKAIMDPTVQAQLERYEMTPNYMNSADYTAEVQKQIKIEKSLIDRLGLAKKD